MGTKGIIRGRHLTLLYIFMNPFHLPKIPCDSPRSEMISLSQARIDAVCTVGSYSFEPILLRASYELPMPFTPTFLSAPLFPGGSTPAAPNHHHPPAHPPSPAHS